MSKKVFRPFEKRLSAFSIVRDGSVQVQCPSVGGSHKCGEEVGERVKEHPCGGRGKGKGDEMRAIWEVDWEGGYHLKCG